MVLASVAGNARADTAAELEAKGEDFAKDGHFSEAIDAFKAADKLEPRASHVCLIALAYTRRELWPQAEIFLDKCHQRATEADPLPSWVPLADQQLQERLAAANVSAVTLVVEPPVPATLAVSSFAPDETFAPRTIHLAPGRHVISTTAPGYEPAQQTIEISDRSDKRVVFTLVPIAVALPPPHLPPVPPAPRPSTAPWIVMGAGGAVMLAGLASHLFLLAPVRDKLQAAHDGGDALAYAQASGSFDTRRTLTVALYGAGVVTIAVGAVLHFTVFKHHGQLPAELQVAVAPTTGGAMVGLEWRR